MLKTLFDLSYIEIIWFETKYKIWLGKNVLIYYQVCGSAKKTRHKARELTNRSAFEHRRKSYTHVHVQIITYNL